MPKRFHSGEDILEIEVDLLGVRSYVLHHGVILFRIPPGTESLDGFGVDLGNS